jgi:flagellar export protein FliJ
MNDTVVARPCWTILANKAEDKIALIQNEMTVARQRLQSLRTSEQRIQKIYDEYREGLTKSDAQSVGMREAMNQRQFMSQLLNLMQRVKTDIQYTENAIIGIKEQLIAQERERIKMQTLADQNAMAVQREENKKDQRRMDALGVMQFNLKPQT